MRYHQKSFRLNEAQFNRPWYVVDASEKVLGRLSVKIANVLMGKDTPQYTSNVDSGAFVVVINAEKVRLTGNKMNDKVYKSFSTRPGHYKEIPIREIMEKKPEFILQEAVRRMLPKGNLGRAMIKKMKIYSGSEHPHEAQKPQVLEL